MNEAADVRLRRLLGGIDLAALRRRLRARYERGAAAREFTLTALTAAERTAIEQLLGRHSRLAASIRVSISDLDAAVARAGLAADFRAALEALDGPLLDRKAERVEKDRAWREAFSAVEEQRLRELLRNATGAALVKRLAGGEPGRGRALLERTQRVLARLPAHGISLARLAAETLGDSHALDAGQPVAALVLRACRAPAGEMAAAGAAASDDDRRENEARRSRWARAGVSVNELAAPALCFGLRACGDTPAGRLSTLAAERGEPVHLSLRALLRRPPPWDVSDRTVYVCENASVVAAAADRLGTECAPLVCTDGTPGAAPQTLLGQLADAGARLRYHGDFDWPGIAIGNFVMRQFGAAPWRFGADDYLAAQVALVLPLSTQSAAAVWDTRLAPAMIGRGCVVHEELVVESLLADLADGRRR